VNDGKDEKGRSQKTHVARTPARILGRSVDCVLSVTSLAIPKANKKTVENVKNKAGIIHIRDDFDEGIGSESFRIRIIKRHRIGSGQEENQIPSKVNSEKQADEEPSQSQDRFS
jgi:hypothetical protein